MEIMERPNNQVINMDGTLGEHYANLYTGCLSYNTRRAYVQDICQFFDVQELKDISLIDIRRVNIATANLYREDLRKQGYALSTINRKLTSMSKFFSILSRRDIGIIEYNPFDSKEGTVRMKQNKRYSNTRCLSTEEVKSLVKVTNGDTLKAIRDRIIVLLLATTGMRREEIVTIKLGNFKRTMGKDVIEIIGKGDKERLIVLSGTIKTLIDKYIAMRGLTYKNGDSYLLTNHSTNGYKDRGQLSDQAIYNVVKSIADRAGLDASDIHPHCLRHTFITEALELGCKLEDVADMAGHSDLSTTRRYDHTNRVINNNPAEKLEAKFLED
jgi:site-specific recombinase XerD